MALTDQLWVEKYRPKTVDDYVFVDVQLKAKVLKWIETKTIPGMLLSGGAGTGKSSLAKVLIHDIGIEDFDVLEINASRENSVETVRTKINGFIQTIPFGKFKVVLLDEADYTSTAFQAALRNDMETYHETVRFILTCNYPHKIIPALKSRCTEFSIAAPDRVEFTTRAATILINENIEFDLDVLDTYVSATYPDLRKCLNQLQVNSTTGTLVATATGNADDSSLLEVTQLFKDGNIYEARSKLLQYLSFNPAKIEDIYVYLYNNLNLFGNTNEHYDAAIVIIRNGLANLPLVGIPEINLAATLVELCNINS